MILQTRLFKGGPHGFNRSTREKSYGQAEIRVNKGLDQEVHTVHTV